MEKNKFGRYLLYAAGEIVLVVIGIIIALQINNWNESRKAFNSELQLYSKLLDDLHSEYRSTSQRIKNAKGYQDVHYQVYNETKGRSQYDSTIYYNSLQWIFPYHLEIAEKYSETLAEITNEKIRELLKSYISREKGTGDAYVEWNAFKVQHLRPFFNKYGIHNTEAAFNDRPYTFNSLMGIDILKHSRLKDQYGTIELDELLFELRFKTSWIFQNLNWQEEKNIELAYALEYELEQNNLPIGLYRTKYLEYSMEAERLYDSKEYQLSAKKYEAAFDQNEGQAYPRDRYNAACSHALVEDIESAFHHLFILGNGPHKYNNFIHISTDPDLEILHKEKRWIELMEIVRLNKENL